MHSQPFEFSDLKFPCLRPAALDPSQPPYNPETLNSLSRSGTVLPRTASQTLQVSLGATFPESSGVEACVGRGFPARVSGFRRFVLGAGGGHLVISSLRRGVPRTGVPFWGVPLGRILRAALLASTVWRERERERERERQRELECFILGFQALKWS